MKRAEILLIFLFVLGFFIRLFPIRTDSSFHYWDESIYLQHAEILGGYREDNYNEFDFRPPLLPILITIGYKIYHSTTTAHLIVASIASLGIISTFFLTKILFKDEKIALIAATIFSFNPLHIVLSHSILTDSMLPTFWSLTIFFFLLAMKKNKNFLFFISGVFLGLSILLKFTSILLALYLILTWFFQKKLKSIFLTLSSSFLTILPYLIFAQFTFNSFLHPFIMAHAVASWDVPTPWHIFYSQFPQLFPIIFSFWILVYVWKKIKVKKISREELLIIIYIILPFIFFQSFVHKEIRFLLPIVPFLSIISAKGFALIESKNKLFIFLNLVIIMLFFYYSLPHFEEILVKIKNLDKRPAIMEAALWINSTTPSDAIVYNNFQFAPLAYYSMRKIQLLPFTRSFQDEIEKVMVKPGYVVVSSLTHEQKEPTLNFLMNDARFRLLKIFEDEEEKIYVFEFIPKAV